MLLLCWLCKNHSTSKSDSAHILPRVCFGLMEVCHAILGDSLILPIDLFSCRFPENVALFGYETFLGIEPIVRQDLLVRILVAGMVEVEVA
ncbi:hypothetical protein V6N13_065340 [Hibiscus sabdariffa]